MGLSKNSLSIAKIILLLLVNVICAPPKTSTPHSSTTPDENLSFGVTTGNPQLPDPGANTPSPLSTIYSEVIANISAKTLEHFSDGPGEVSDLLQVVKKKIENDTGEYYKYELSETDAMDQESVEYYSRIEVPKSETELIENGEDTEDVWANQRDMESTENGTGAEPSGHHTRGETLTRKMEEDRSWLQEEVLAVISVLFLLVLVFSCTMTLMLRKYYRTQYGNRQILINEEDMCDPNDMKYFSL